MNSLKLYTEKGLSSMCAHGHTITTTFHLGKVADFLLVEIFVHTGGVTLLMRLKPIKICHLIRKWLLLTYCMPIGTLEKTN